MVSRRRFVLAGAAALVLPRFALAMTEPPLPPDASAPLLVLDTPFDDDAYRHFRDGRALAAAAAPKGIDVTGLADLKISGSAQFSSPAWAALRRGPLSGTVLDVDLRQESHGFLNGAAVTWAAEDDWSNVGMAHNEAIAVENDRLARLKAQKTVTPPTADAFKHGGAPQGPAVQVQAVTDEAQLVTASGASYLRLTVTDHLRPHDGEVDRFLAALAAHPADGRVHVHCRGGDGRTTTFMALFDMLANADKVTAEAIFARQATVSPFYDLAKIAEGPKAVYYRERLDFLQRFHAYAVARKKGETKTWSQWAKT